MRLLALDFDGVVSDSAPECFVVALRSYAALHPDSEWIASHVSWLGAGVPALAAVRAAAGYDAFVERMPLGNRAEDFGVVLASLEAAASMPDQASYDAFRDARGQAWLDAFHERFYRERDALCAADPEAWYGLMSPYDALLPVLHRRAESVRLAIATAKDGPAVARLLERYGLRRLFPTERVMDKETGVHKEAHLRALAAQESLPFEAITFVDDKVNHLDRVAPLGVRCVLAAWGYNGEREARLARERGYRVLDLAGFEPALFPDS